MGTTSLELCVPGHSTLSRRAKTREASRPQPRRNGEPLHLLADSTGLRLCGAGEWLLEKHGAKTRRSWRKLHIGVDAGTGQVVAASLTAKQGDDGAEAGPLLDQDHVYAGVDPERGLGRLRTLSRSVQHAGARPYTANVVPTNPRYKQSGSYRGHQISLYDSVLLYKPS